MKSQRVGGGAGRVRGRTISNMYTAAVFHETQIFLFFFFLPPPLPETQIFHLPTIIQVDI